MSTQRRPKQPELEPRVAAVFADMRATRNSDFITGQTVYLGGIN